MELAKCPIDRTNKMVIITEINYENEFNKKFHHNLSETRKNIDSPEIRQKIRKLSDKTGKTPVEIRNEILSSDLAAMLVMKDPARQNLFRNKAKEYISEIKGFRDFRAFPISGNSALYILKGRISHKHTRESSRIDFKWKFNDTVVYAKHIYTRGSGGTQKNQMSKIIKFLKNCQSNTEYIFVAICDGNFYDAKRITELRKEFATSNIYICKINELTFEFLKET